MTAARKGVHMGPVRKRFMTFALALAMLCSCIPATVYAEAAQAMYAAASDASRSGGWQFDPLRMERVPLAENSVFRRRVRTGSSATGTTCTTLDAAAQVLREGLIARKSEITLSFPVEAGFDVDDIWQSAMRHNGTPGAGDYLLWQIGALGWNLYRNTVSGTDCYTITFMVDYYTTAAQEAQVDAAVKSLLAQLALDGRSDAEKIRAIYDWICTNVTYDQTNLNNSSYVLKYTAYAALIDRTAVCQGYALLLYRLALELGVDMRFISGTANGGGHGWNIVCLDGLYYNLDATWDATRRQAGMDYSWYLRGSSNFTDHVRDDDYLTPEFVQAYPTDPADYGVQVTWPVTGKCGDALTWELSREGVLTISGTGEMDDYYTENPGWYDYAWQVHSVVIQDGVTSVGANAFYYCTELESVTIRGKTDLHEMAFLHCEALQSVSMEQCTAIGNYAFLNCKSLTEIHIPASVKTIGEQAFRGCTALRTITVAEGSTTYRAQGNVLLSKDGTKLLVAGAALDAQYSVPSGVTQIAAYAFSACAALQSITLPEGVTNVLEGTFYGCAALRSVTLPEGLLSIGDTAFYGCKTLSELTFPGLLKSIGYAAFYGCRALRELSIPASVAEIGAEAFCGCDGVQTIRFAGEAPTIGEDAFRGIYAQAYYPDREVFTSWTLDALNSYGGFLQWTMYLPHEYTAVVTDPTCTEQGYTTYTCSKCGDTYKGNYTAATGHSWDDGVVTKEPTETDVGIRKYTCGKCKTTRTEEIPRTDHVHHYTDKVTPPTCTDQGYTTHTCDTCGDSYRDTYTAATGHSYGDWTQTAAPSCTKPGEKKRTCANCTHYEVAQIAAIGHDCTVTVVAPTCTAQGYTLHSCKNCDYSYKDAFTDALGHDFGQWYEVTAAACGTPGREQHDCSRCDHYEQQETAALAHSYTDTVTPPTCTEQGYTTHVCDKCGHSYRDAQTEPTGHRFTAYRSDGNATCTADGTETASCDHGCGKTDTRTQSGSKKKHTYGQWSTVTAPTRETEGLKRRTCDVCGHVQEEAIPILTGVTQIESEQYTVSDTTVGGVAPGTTVAQLLSAMTQGEYLCVYRGEEKLEPTQTVGTGMRLCVADDETGTLSRLIVVRGDINGDGAVSVTDMLCIKSHLLGKSTLEGAAAEAADLNADGAISITDFLQSKAQLLGK